MKFSASIILLSAASRALVTEAFLVVPNFLPYSLPKAFTSQRQIPIMGNAALPPSKVSPGDSDVSVGSLSISDVIGKERVINIFAGFTSMSDMSVTIEYEVV